jgi:hypothetical protein
MKSYLLFAAIILNGASGSAQLSRTDSLKQALDIAAADTVAWTYGGVLNLGLNQVFLHNWAAGGEVTSLTVNGQFNGFMNRIYHRHIWANNLDLTYGLFYAYSNTFVPRKIDDRIDVTSKYGVQINNSKRFYFSALANLKTQFTKGFDYSVPGWDTFSASAFLSPAYLTAALGVEYRHDDKLSLFLSPVAARITVADRYYTSRAPEGAFGIPYNKTHRFELGAYFSGRYLVEVNKTLLYRSRLDLYTNYLAKNKTDSQGFVVKKDNPGNIDVLWDNFLSYKVSKYLSVNIAATFIYDNDIPYQNTYIDESGDAIQKDEPGGELGWWQVKQMLTIGFQYRF